jgi:catechol 2,3-dioxygenase-like lactoylglutathione lyase family enzyme
MSHPVLLYMPAVFIPVSDLKRSIEWYSSLLEQPVQPKQDGGGIYYFDLDNTDIILDSNMWGFPPMIMFDTQDIDAAYEFCQDQRYLAMGHLQRFPDVAFFNVFGNMICQAGRRPVSEQTNPVHPLLQRISRVLVHADALAESEGWYETFLQKSPTPDPTFEGLPYVCMNRGAHLLIDDNRFAQTEKVRYDRLQLDLRVNPVFIIETPDVEEALLHVRNKGATIKTGIENRFGVSFFTFYDPDDNGLMVCQSK